MLLDLADVFIDFVPRFHHVVCVLQTQPVAFGQLEEMRKMQVCIGSDAAPSANDFIDTVRRNADGLR